MDRPGRRGENREGGISPAAERGENGPGHALGGHRKPLCSPFPAGPFLGAARREENGPAGLSGQKWGNGPGENPTGNRPTGREILEGPRRRRETPENTAALALRGPQGRLPGPAGPFFLPPGGRNQPKRAEKGPGRPGAPQRVPVTPQSHAGMVLAARRRERDGRDTPFPAGPGGKNRDTPGPSGSRPRGPDGSHHEGRRPAGPAGQPAI